MGTRTEGLEAGSGKGGPDEGFTGRFDDVFREELKRIVPRATDGGDALSGMTSAGRADDDGRNVAAARDRGGAAAAVLTALAFADALQLSLRLFAMSLPLLSLPYLLAILAMS